jgi:hypothetical protein
MIPSSLFRLVLFGNLRREMNVFEEQAEEGNGLYQL